MLILPLGLQRPETAPKADIIEYTARIASLGPEC